MKRFGIGVMLVLLAVCAQAQVRVMSYNMLNFPTGNIPGRVDTLKRIVDFVKPDLLLIQELKTEQGLLDVADMMNELDYAAFLPAPFVPQQSDPGSPYDLQQALIYNQNIFALAAQDEIITAVRDINMYKLYVLDEGLASASDTTFLHVFVTHLKSSTGSANEQTRADMAQHWVNYAAAHLNADDNVIFAGDLNLYSNTELAYQRLVADTNAVVLHDVFENYGNWNSSSFAHKEILTQSTRQYQLQGDGAGGGIDDRFDFIFLSDAMMQDQNTIRLIPDSFFSLGNTGLCYNQDITDCNFNNGVPDSVLTAIYFMSDHIPQICDLEINLALNVPSTEPFEASFFWVDREDRLEVHLQQMMDGAHWILRDALGRQITNGPCDQRIIAFAKPQMQPGLYFFTWMDREGHAITRRLICK